MAIVYSKNDQGRTITVCDSLPVHIGVTGDEAIDISTGKKYIYTSSSWAEFSTGGAVAFSPMDVAACDLAPTAATTQYYYQTVSTVTGTVNKVKMWGFSGSDTVLFGLYRGALGGLKTLIGQGSALCAIGENTITLTPEVGQTLNVTAGETLTVGYYANGTSWRTVYDDGISDTEFGILNTANITTMPLFPTGTATSVRFACTLFT